MYRVYDSDGSGNGYKVWLLLNFLRKPYKWVGVDILAGETKSPDFLKINPVGKIPVLEFEDGRRLIESNAIMTFLADGTDWIPSDPFQKAQMFSWMFWEQYSHEPNVAVLRFWHHYLEMTPELKAQVPEKEKKAYAALDIMEMQLSHTDWLVGDGPTLADIALYAYTHVAEEAELDMSDYPAIRAWIGRFAALPGYVPITFRP